MKIYTKEERINMIFILGECRQNCLLASRVYAHRFPVRNHPKPAVFERLLNQFRESGSVSYKKPITKKPVTEDEDNVFSVVGAVIENPNISQNQISENTNVSQASISRILKKHRFHPYKIKLFQEMYGNDFDKRIEFCMWVLDKVAENTNFFDNVLFSDECTFHNNALVNRHNLHYYSDSNPHEYRVTRNQNRWSVNVWGGILGPYLIGPYFFEGPLNGVMFLDFLLNQLPILLEEVPLNIRTTMWLQLDGAPPHYHCEVRQFLNDYFQNRWIGRNGFQNWPARSPDLTPPDFFLWGYVKGIVYNTPPATPQDMKIRIRDAFETITPQMLCRVVSSFQKRICKCLEMNGRHFEHLL